MHSPSDPGEGDEGLERVAVGEVRVGAVLTTAECFREGSGACEPEDPGEEEPDSVTSDRGDYAADAGEEEHELEA